MSDGTEYLTTEQASVYKDGERDWLNPLAMRMLQNAVKGNKKEVILNGTKYRITYGYRRTYPASKETVDSVRLNRADGTFVPMGYIPIKKILNFKFEGE